MEPPYLPPHKKRLTSSSTKPLSPTPSPQVHRHNSYPSFNSLNKRVASKPSPVVSAPKNTIFSNTADIEWVHVGLAHGSQLSTSTHLKPYASHASEETTAETQQILVLNDSHAIRGDMAQRLCTAAEIRFYFHNFVGSLSGDTNYLNPNINCNLSTWISGCEPGWACRAGDQTVNLEDPHEIPARSVECQPCCEGFFCPQEDGEGIRELPWENIAEKGQNYFKRLKNETVEDGIEQAKPKLVAQFGKILFEGGYPDGKEADVNNLKQRNRTFFTNVPSAYMDYMSKQVVSKLELKFKLEKEFYYVEVSDVKQPGLEILCKCTASEDHTTLKLLKAKLSPVCHFLADISCLGKELDLRLMLCAKQKSRKDLTADENIKLLISRAIIDPRHIGGLRWPLGDDPSGDRYTVCGAWHITAKIYENSSMRLEVRQKDRYDLRLSEGQRSEEVKIKMSEIASLLQDPTLESKLLSETLKDNLELIWKYCLDSSPKAQQWAVLLHKYCIFL